MDGTVAPDFKQIKNKSMESKDLNPAREEYFSRLCKPFIKYLETSSFDEEELLKDRILSMTYDKNVELQKRVEELESGLTGIQKRFATKAGYITGGLYEIIENLLPPKE